MMPSEPELRFYYGVMGCGKSTLALQITHNLRQAGHRVVLLTKLGREDGMVTSRLGVKAKAARTKPNHNFYEFAEYCVGIKPSMVTHFVCDEVQFFTEEQIDQLAAIVDNLGANVYAFGLLSTFQGELFDGSKRMMVLADNVREVNTESKCGCGRKAVMNARLVDGVVVSSGDVNVVGDINDETSAISYEAMCRKCWTGFR